MIRPQWKSFRENWKAGAKSPEYHIIIDAVMLSLVIGPTIFSPIGSGWIVGIIFFSTWLLGMALLVPIGISMIPASSSAQLQIATELEPTVDQILNHVDVNWSETSFGQIAKLVKSGDKTAAKQYRNTIGVTWDQADAAIKDWPMTVLKAKLDAIEKALSGRNAVLAG